MTRSLLLILLTMLGLSAQDTNFDGRWNIHVKTPRGRMWWLEVQGSASGKLHGSFVGAPGGQVDVIQDMKIEKGELSFRFENHASSRDAKSPIVKQVYRAKLAGGQLNGTREEEVSGKASPVLTWTGVRAPVINEHDDGRWKAGRTVALFDGKSLAGWRQLLASEPGWYVEGGVLKNKDKASDLLSDAKFWNFEVKLEYRYAKGSNSGMALRGRYEIQIFDNFGAAPDWHGNGALYSRIAPSTNASKAPGEWQTLTARLVGRELTVVLNGVKVIDRKDVVGPTAMCMDADEDKPGPLMLQGDHGPVEFRKVEVTELQLR
ncbi:3-keto-disaccharide hydrolase [Paludibaculum fermentans]|uniref:DUF1080 domain-containing protein n=1 Tax=Paludibaculum fermentans TaxID=1473598 RepID=A0A7S7NWK2_PALFE|nr:DUF1080 domain-containing protein [Paludibaculum fermentans]QOY91080.1 DUF1080 domain-containing protein [Paludibaculum fermentans]